MLAAELRGEIDNPDAPALPTTLPEVIRLVHAVDGVRFRDLLAALCPDPHTTEQALQELLATATLDRLPTDPGHDL